MIFDMPKPLYRHRPQRLWTGRFSLRTLFVLMSLACLAVWLGPDAWLVYQRRAMRAWIIQSGGDIRLLSWYMYPQERFPAISIPKFRQWIGDEAVAEIELPTGAKEADVQ